MPGELHGGDPIRGDVLKSTRHGIGAAARGTGLGPLLLSMSTTKGIRQIGAILHAKAVSATVVKPFGFATGDWEGSRCGIRTRIALQNPVAQVVVAILWSHGPFATPGQGGCSLGMHGSPPKRRDKKARRSAAGRPSRRFGPPRRSWGLTRGLTHCVRSRLRRELYHPQRSSETLRLACKIAPICLIPSPGDRLGSP